MSTNFHLMAERMKAHVVMENGEWVIKGAPTPEIHFFQVWQTPSLVTESIFQNDSLEDILEAYYDYVRSLKAHRPAVSDIDERDTFGENGFKQYVAYSSEDSHIEQLKVEIENYRARGYTIRAYSE